MNARRESRSFWWAYLLLALIVALIPAWFLLMLAVAGTITA
ncbi:hypothetical protein [Nocardia niwae]|nr:hypothetical protein [Nocardia niwae]